MIFCREIKFGKKKKKKKKKKVVHILEKDLCEACRVNKNSSSNPIQRKMNERKKTGRKEGCMILEQLIIRDELLLCLYEESKDE